MYDIYIASRDNRTVCTNFKTKRGRNGIQTSHKKVVKQKNKKISRTRNTIVKAIYSRPVKERERNEGSSNLKRCL